MDTAGGMARKEGDLCTDPFTSKPGRAQRVRCPAGHAESWKKKKRREAALAGGLNTLRGSGGSWNACQVVGRNCPPKLGLFQASGPFDTNAMPKVPRHFSNSLLPANAPPPRGGSATP